MVIKSIASKDFPGGSGLESAFQHRGWGVTSDGASEVPCHAVCPDARKENTGSQNRSRGRESELCHGAGRTGY